MCWCRYVSVVLIVLVVFLLKPFTLQITIHHHASDKRLHRQLVCQIQRANTHNVRTCVAMFVSALPCVCSFNVICVCALCVSSKPNMNFWLCLIACSCELVRSIFADDISVCYLFISTITICNMRNKNALLQAEPKKVISCTVYTHPHTHPPTSNKQELLCMHAWCAERKTTINAMQYEMYFVLHYIRALFAEANS